MKDKAGQSTATKPATLSMAEAITRLKATGSSGAAAPAEAGNAKRAAPTQEAQPNGLEPEVTNPDDDGESDTGGSVDAADPGAEEGEGTDEADDAKDPLVVVTIDGEEVEVSLSELIASYSKGTDYTNKTKALAESRRAVDQQAKEIAAERDALKAERSEMQTVRQRYEGGLAAFERTISAPDAEWAKVDWKQLKEDDPLQYGVLVADYQMHKENVAHAKAEAARVAAEKQEEARREHAETLRTLKKGLDEDFPHWSDETIRNKEWSGMVKTAKAAGFSDEEIGGTTDHRIFKVLHKAMKYDRQAATRASATSPAPNRVPGRGADQKPPAKVVTPSGARPVIRAGNRGGGVANVRDAWADLKTAATRQGGGNSVKAGIAVLAALRQASAKASRR